MKYVLIWIVFGLSPGMPPTIAHKAFDSSVQCEQAKDVFLKQEQPPGRRGAAICLSELELLNYTRT